MTEYWILGLASLAVWLATTAAYRVYFHPLSRFPGPKLAALTTWYEAYYDVGKQGQYIFQIEKMHGAYGPVVRIGPNELHILDHEYYDTLYNMTNRLDKSPYFYRMLGNPKAMFGTISAKLHRVRRGAVSPFFSSQAVRKFSSNMQTIVDRLIARMEACGQKGEPIPLFYANRCLTVDIITEYLFAHQFRLLDRVDWGRSFYLAWRKLWELSPTIRQFPWMLDAIMGLPRWMTAATDPQALEVVDIFADVNQQTRILLETDEEEIKAKPHPAVVWELARTDALPPSEKTFERLAVEANSLLAAGFETTGGILTYATYLVLAHSEVHRKLLDELEKAILDPNQIPSSADLEKLPYLVGVVKESLRLAVGAWSRLPRVNPTETMQYKDWVIPAGTAVGISALFITRNSALFQDPESFIPERWTDESAKTEHLERYLLAFGKGTRSCVGINLAYAELYIVLATIFRRFPSLELYNTTELDVEHVHDYFSGMTRRDTEGLQVKIG